MAKITKRIFSVLLGCIILICCTACDDAEIHSFSVNDLPPKKIDVGTTSDELKVEVDYFRSFQTSDVNVVIADDSIISVDYEAKESLRVGYYVSYTITGLRAGTTSYYFETKDRSIKSATVEIEIIDTIPADEILESPSNQTGKVDENTKPEDPLGETTGQMQEESVEMTHITPYRIINEFYYRLEQVFGDTMPSVEKGKYDNNFVLNFEDFTLLVFVNSFEEDPRIMNLQLTGTETNDEEYMRWVELVFTALLGSISEDEFTEMMNFAKASPIDQLGGPNFSEAISSVMDILYYETAATSTTTTYTIKAEYTE